MEDNMPADEQMDIKAMEERFLEGLSADPLSPDALLDDLRLLVRAGRLGLAREWAQLLQETLVDRFEGEALLRVLETIAVWPGSDAAWGALASDALRRAFKSRDLPAYLEAADFDSHRPIDALRRLRRLRSLTPGTPCLDKTWGFGVVRDSDAFYRRVTVDFYGRPGHAVSFAHAADSMEQLGEKHVLTQRHADPEAFSARVRKEPGAIVRDLLESFGPMNLARLETTLADHGIVSAEGWKSFWDAARKALRGDAGVDIPRKRNDPITLRTTLSGLPADESTFASLIGERDPKKILAQIREWEADGGVGESLSEEDREALSDRLRFALTGARGVDDALFAQLTLVAARMAVARVDVDVLRAELLLNRRFAKAAHALGARDAEALAIFVLGGGGEESVVQVLEALESLPLNLVDGLLSTMMDGPQADACRAAVRRSLHSVEPPPALLVWALRNRARAQAWGMIEVSELMTHAVAALGPAYGGERLRMQNRIRRYFSSDRNFEAAFNELDSLRGRALFDRLQVSPGWDSTDLRSVLARMIKLCPELGEHASKRAEAVTSSKAAPKQRMTSWRSLEERRAQLTRIIEVEIPANSREIGVARSYGDLRENFEYHAAKHQQGLLQQRRAELERDLEQVHGTDFSDVSTDCVGMGVCVTVRGADGEDMRHVILGEWDRDETLGIISCRSQVAETLDGRRIGDNCELPDAEGKLCPAQVVAIEPLDADVRAWIGARVQ